MISKISIALSIFIIFTSFVTKADKRNVLFIGNSYTYFNGGMPTMIASIATSLGDTLTHESSTPGGYTAQQHTTNTTTLNKIAQGNWDYVSIQCQSQEPSFPIGQVNTQTLPFVLQLDSAIQAGNSCAETLFFMTWGRINGDLQNYPNDTYNDMQQRLRDGYMYFVDSANSSVSPVGAAWKVMRDSLPNINLYNADGSHPSLNGTYLAACVFYCSIFKKSCAGSMYLPGGIGNGDAIAMQNVASMVVLDSIENWHSEGGIPDADFSHVPVTAGSGFFTNNSLRYATSEWDFGDGSPIATQQDLGHNFPSAGGTFNVCLTVTSACGKKDSTCQTIMVGPSSTSSFSATDKIKILQNAHQIIIDNEYANCTLILSSMNGRKIRSIQLTKGRSNISMNDLSKGIYVLQIKQNGSLLKRQKISNN